MNCEQFRLQFHTGDVTDSSDLLAHRQSCPDCEAFAIDAKAFDANIRTVMARVELPSHGPAQVLDSLKSQVRRKARRRVIEVLAVAASLFLAVGAGYVWRGWQIPVTEDVSISQTNPGDGFQAWAETLDYEFNPSVKFNRNLFVSKGAVSIKPGINIPSVTLINGESNAMAQIYVVSIDKIDEAAILKLVPNTPLMNWRILKDSKYPDRVRYLVIFTGSLLEAFLSPPNDI